MAVSGEEFGDLRDRVTRLEERQSTLADTCDERHAQVKKELEDGDSEFSRLRGQTDGVWDALRTHETNHPRCQNPCVPPSHAFPVPGPESVAPSPATMRKELDDAAERLRKNIQTAFQAITLIAVLVALLIPWVCNVRPNGVTP